MLDMIVAWSIGEDTANKFGDDSDVDEELLQVRNSIWE
jgi:hypothetical protein